jgi:hypothetical protein
MRLPDLGGLMQQPPNEKDALAALRLGAERAVYHRHRAVFTLGMGPEVSIGDAVAETDVHSCSHPKSMSFISLADMRTIRNIICTSGIHSVELPQHAADASRVPRIMNMSKSGSRERMEKFPGC